MAKQKKKGKDTSGKGKPVKDVLTTFKHLHAVHMIDAAVKTIRRVREWYKTGSKIKVSYDGVKVLCPSPPSAEDWGNKEVLRGYLHYLMALEWGKIVHKSWLKFPYSRDRVAMLYTRYRKAGTAKKTVMVDGVPVDTETKKLEQIEADIAAEGTDYLPSGSKHLRQLEQIVCVLLVNAEDLRNDSLDDPAKKDANSLNDEDRELLWETARKNWRKLFKQKPHRREFPLSVDGTSEIWLACRKRYNEQQRKWFEKLKTECAANGVIVDPAKLDIPVKQKKP